MEKEQALKKLNAEELYNKALNYEIGGDTFYGGATTKVVKAQKLLRNSNESADYKEAVQLLQEVCLGETKSKKKPSPKIIDVRKYELPSFLSDDAPLLMAAENSFEYRDMRLRRGSLCRRSEPKERPQKAVEDDDSKDALALAHILLGELYRMGKGIGKDPNEAIRMLRMANKFGSEQGLRLENMAKAMMKQIIEEEEEATIADTINSKIEIREKRRMPGARGGERYTFILHHANGQEDEIKLKGRNTLVYMLALMTVKRKDASKLRARLFSAHHGALVELAGQVRISTRELSYEEWIYEFGYQMAPEFKNRNDLKEGQSIRYIYDTHNYSQTKDKINRKIDQIAHGESFKLVSIGNRENSFMSIPIDPEQIIIPDSLMGFVNDLPSDEKVLKKNPTREIYMPYHGE